MAATATQWKDVTDLKAKKKKILTDMRGLYAKADTEKRELSPEEQAQFDKMSADITVIDQRVSNIETLMDYEEEGEGEGEDREDGNMDDENTDGNDSRSRLPREKRRTPPKSGKEGKKVPLIDPENPHYQRRSTLEYREAVNAYVKSKGREQRALQMDVDVKGGYLVLPVTISNNILKAVDDLMPMSEKCTVITVTDAASLGIPTIEDSGSDAEWTTEISQILLDDTMRFGKRQLTPTPIRKRILVSERFLRMAFSVTRQSDDNAATANGLRGKPDQVVSNRMAYTIARTLEKALMTGNGVGKPLGMFVASSRGISTARDIPTGAATGITWPALYDLKYSLKAQYHNRAEWFFHRLFMKRVLQLASSSTNIPIYDASTLPRQPDQLLECPINLSEFCPSTFTDQSYVAMLCDPQFYYVARSQEITIKILWELYAETGQVGFIVTSEADGMPVLEEAFARFKCGTS